MYMHCLLIFEIFLAKMQTSKVQARKGQLQGRSLKGDLQENETLELSLWISACSYIHEPLKKIRLFFPPSPIFSERGQPQIFTLAFANETLNAVGWQCVSVSNNQYKKQNSNSA